MSTARWLDAVAELHRVVDLEHLQTLVGIFDQVDRDDAAADRSGGLTTDRFDRLVDLTHHGGAAGAPYW